MSGLLAGLSILVIGASQFAHEGYLISSLHDNLVAQGAQVASYGACGTFPHSWLRAPQPVMCGTAVHIGRQPVEEDEFDSSKTWRAVDLIHKHHPQLVIVGIADTLANYRSPSLDVTWVRSEVKGLVDRIAAEHVACIWLGTTWGTEGGMLGKNFKRVQELSAVLRDAVAPCEYVDSLSFSKPGEWATVDGQHHTTVAYQLWGKALTQAIDHSKVVLSLKP